MVGGGMISQVTAFLTNKYWDCPFENAFRVELTWFHKLLVIVFALAFTNVCRAPIHPQASFLSNEFYAL
jgi:hypothetical protein